MDQWIDRFKSSETIEGQSEVIIPGEPEAKIHLDRLASGIPLIDAVYQDLQKICSDLEVDFTL